LDEVCRGCPELLAKVGERWKEFRRIDAALVELHLGLRTAPDVGIHARAPRRRPAAGARVRPGWPVMK
jgi:hypothetical protein